MLLLWKAARSTRHGGMTGGLLGVQPKVRTTLRLLHCMCATSCWGQSSTPLPCFLGRSIT